MNNNKKIQKNEIPNGKKNKKKKEKFVNVTDMFFRKEE